jgi:hypothetical protein
MTCDLCGGPLGILGVLGNTEHIQCRDCGAEFSRPAAPPEEDEEADFEGDPDWVGFAT